jgi:hypothetical protein
MFCELAYAEAYLNNIEDFDKIMKRILGFIKRTKPYIRLEYEVLDGDLFDLRRFCSENGLDYIRSWDQESDLDGGSAIYVACWEREQQICRCQPDPELTQIRPALTATRDVIAQIEDLVSSGLDPEDYLKATAAAGPTAAEVPTQTSVSDLPLFSWLAAVT